MANERYNFKYLPLVGKLPGKSMVEQTETAINELASVVYDNVGHVGNLAEEVQTANTNASNALEKATEALETSGRVYIKQIAAVDVNDYYDSELYYINNDGSTNIPVRDRGFLEVKTNDDKTACEQVFIADSTGTPYYRHGRITKQTLGEETTYVVTWSSWYRVATTEAVVTYKYYPYKDKAEWESNCVQSIAEGMATDHPNSYNYGLQVSLGDVNNGANARLYFPQNGPMYVKTFWNASNTVGWRLILDDRNFSYFALTKNGTAVRAKGDDAGNIISSTYAKKSDLSTSVSTTSLTVTGATSVPTANAGNSSKAIANTEFVAKSISALVNGAPDQLNTLNELAKALGNDSNFAATVTAELAKKLNSTEAESTYAKKSDLASSAPTGVVQAFAGSTTPQGWLLCDGSAVSRTNYAALFTAIGTTYGSGNGSTTFNLPNLVDKFVEGSATAGTVKSAGLPNIKGSITKIMYYSASSATGAFRESNSSKVRQSDGSPQPSTYDYDFDASRSNSIYGNSTTVQPPALTMRYIIKY